MSYDLVFSFCKAMASNCKKLTTTDLKRALTCQYRNRVFQTTYKLNLQRQRDVGHVAEELPCTKNSTHSIQCPQWHDQQGADSIQQWLPGPLLLHAW
jgi:hypothetical protein